jgi:hypothetical protein
MPTEPRQFDDWKRHAVYLRDGYKCAYSGYVDTTCTGKRLSLDHIIPIHGSPPAGGGPLQNKRGEPATNLTTAHAPTNFAKGNRTQEQWKEYAANHMPPKAGIEFDWKTVEKGAQAPLDMKRGEQLSKLAAQARGARQLDANGKRTIETPKSKAIAEKSAAIVASYQAEQAASAKLQKNGGEMGTWAKHDAKVEREGPGVAHDKAGRFQAGGGGG